MRRGFSLVELLVVILIIATSYGVVYNLALMPENDESLNDSQTLIKQIKTHPSYGSKGLRVYCDEDGACLVGSIGKAFLEDVISFRLEMPIRSYILDDEESFVPIDPPLVTHERKSFRPMAILYVSSRGVIHSAIVENDDGWLYFSHLQGDFLYFESGEALIRHMKKIDYLPSIAGERS